VPARAGRQGAARVPKAAQTPHSFNINSSLMASPKTGSICLIRLSMHGVDPGHRICVISGESCGSRKPLHYHCPAPLLPILAPAATASTRDIIDTVDCAGVFATAPAFFYGFPDGPRSPVPVSSMEPSLVDARRVRSCIRSCGCSGRSSSGCRYGSRGGRRCNSAG